MIKVTTWYTKNTCARIKVSGHAGFDETGKDLICAGVSCIMFGLMNGLDTIGGTIIEQGDDLIDIKVEELKSKKIQDYLELVVVQLLTIYDQYPEYITIERRKDS